MFLLHDTARKDKAFNAVTRRIVTNKLKQQMKYLKKREKCV